VGKAYSHTIVNNCEFVGVQCLKYPYFLTTTTSINFVHRLPTPYSHDEYKNTYKSIFEYQQQLQEK